jgi:hypothetical protein
MRITVYDMRSDTQNHALAMRAIILLDGVRQTRCTVADSDAGYIERYVTESPDQFAEEWPTEKLFGKVTIIDPDAQLHAGNERCSTCKSFQCVCDVPVFEYPK